MSIFEDELRRRLKSGKIRETARWYLRVGAAADLTWDDMSPLEQRFFFEIRKSYQRWLKNRRLN